MLLQVASPTYAPVPQTEATETVPTASAPVPPTPTPKAPAAPLDHLFDDGLAAYRRGDWASASELLAAVIYQDPGFTKDGVNAAQLLVEADGRIASQPAPQVQQVIPQQAIPQQIPPQPMAYESSATDAYYVPQTATVAAPRPRRAIIIIPALIVLALLVVGGIVWFLAQNASHDQEIAAASTATAVAERDAAATAAVEDATSTALAIEANATSAAADATAAAALTATTISDDATQVAMYAEQTNVAHSRRCDQHGAG